MVEDNETVSLGWCDNGLTDGKFTEGLMTAVIIGPKNGTTITNSIRVQGNQISRQRQVLFDHWADKMDTDWLLWVDSDIVLNLDALTKIWKAADKTSCPVVSGVYFISKENEGTLVRPFPAVFNDLSTHKIEYVHPLPLDQVIKVDNAGFGLVIMHRSIVDKLRKTHPGKGLFMETGDDQDEHYVGEDIIFFRKMRTAGIPLHCHTGALVKHMKRFSLDADYYNMYWNYQNMQEKPEVQET